MLLSASRRLAVLVCGEIHPAHQAAHGTMRDMYFHFLAASLARINPDVTFTLDAYDVVNEMAYPPDSDHYNGLFITGSLASAHQDIEWINTLVTYVKRIVTEKPTLKIVGLCFGHQIIARALGGTCAPNEDGWEVAVTTIQLTPLGKAMFGCDELDIQQMHGDHVPTAPPRAHILGSTANTANHGMVIFEPTLDDSDLGADSEDDVLRVPLTSVHMLTIQGHPEFTAPFMSVLLDVGLPIDGKVIQDGHLREGGVPGRDHHHPDGLACDGVGRVGKVIWSILGVS